MRDQHAVWEEIASSFDRSRTRTWDHVVDFLDALPEGARVLDLMCGNGRHVPPALQRRLRVVGADWSRPLCRIVGQRHGVPVAVADATRLPFRDGAFDACIYVAGLHGLATGRDRRASLAEMRRVVRPGGRAQVTVWSRDAPRFCDRGERGQPLDVVLPWRSDGHDAPRRYHLYTPGSLQEDVIAAGLEVERTYEAQIISERPDNLVVEARA